MISLQESQNQKQLLDYLSPWKCSTLRRASGWRSQTGEVPDLTRSHCTMDDLKFFYQMMPAAVHGYQPLAFRSPAPAPKIHGWQFQRISNENQAMPKHM